MPKFIIERVVPGAGNLTADDLKAISIRSCDVLNKLGPTIQWVQSYVTDNKIYCVYIANDQDVIREHAKLAGIPANHIVAIKEIIDPTTSEG
jgi:Nickel responsive protein SCO4226-like